MLLQPISTALVSSNFKSLNRCNLAADSCLSLQFGTKFDYMTQTFKIKESNVKVTA